MAVFFVACAQPASGLQSTAGYWLGENLDDLSCTDDATALLAATKKYLDEGNRALRSQLAAFNRLRQAAGLVTLVIHEERRVV